MIIFLRGENMTNLFKCLLRIPLNQPIIVSLFLYCFKLIVSRMFLFPVCKTALLMKTNSFFAGLMSLAVGLLLKFSSWVFRVRNLLFLLFISNQFAIFLFFKIHFPSTLIGFFYLFGGFLVFRDYGVVYHVIAFHFS